MGDSSTYQHFEALILTVVLILFNIVNRYISHYQRLLHFHYPGVARTYSFSRLHLPRDPGLLGSDALHVQKTC